MNEPASRVLLVDKSVLARIDKPGVSAALLPHVGQLATCSTVLLEMGWSARNSKHYAQIVEDLRWYHHLAIDQDVLDLAHELQARLVKAARHRGPGVADLVLSATAISHDAELVHYDADFEHVAEVDDRLRQRWIVPPGSAD